MSGIYIPIKVPKGCSGCPIDSDCCTLWQQLPSERLGDTRPRDCPIVIVPDHGRLIDADKLTISTAVPIDGKPYQYVHIDNIKAAPTIIPADKEA